MSDGRAPPQPSGKGSSSTRAAEHGASHNETVQAEFTRQAETFRSSSTLGAVEVTTRVADALGPSIGLTLDLACGPGILLPALSTRSRAVVGVDLTPANLRLAREADTRGPLHLVRALAERLPFAPGRFDAVVLRLALHHFPQPEAVLAAVRPLLDTNGRLVVLDVLGPEDPGQAALRDAIERLRDPSHTALLSRNALHAVLERTGFRVEEESLWSQPRQFAEWAAIINEPRRLADLELVLRALPRGEADPTGLALREEDGALGFTYAWGLFVARRK